MKKSLLKRTLKPTFLAIPAAALMLGAAHAGSTIGLNFQAWYYSDGGRGYQTTGFPVTGKAFGVDAVNWISSPPLSCGFYGGQGVPIVTNITSGSLVFNVQAPNTWMSGIGEQVGGLNPETVAPGNDEVTWGYLADGYGNGYVGTNTAGGFPSVSASGLATQFPNGYIVGTIAACHDNVPLQPVDIVGGGVTNTLNYSIYYKMGPTNDGYYTTPGEIGITTSSTVFIGDSVSIIGHPKTTSTRSVLAGLIITDKPVVNSDPAGSTNFTGTLMVLNAGAIGIPPLSYQWQKDGSPISGATSANYTINNLSLTDAGDYTVVVTNLYGSTTSAVASVSVSQSPPLIAANFLPTTNLVYVGFVQTLAVTATGSLPFTYQWQLNGVPIAGATNSSLTISNSTVGLFGYSAAVANSAGANSITNYLNVVPRPANPYSTQVAMDAPVSYWPLNETSGSIAYDYAGFSHNGALNGGVTLGVAGPQSPALTGFGNGNLAYQFDGSSSYIACNTNASLGSNTDFTVETWINTTAAAGSQIVNQRDSSGSGYIGEYTCGINADGTLSFDLYGTGGYQFQTTSKKNVNDGNWHHIAFIRSGTNGIIYIDGALNAISSSTNSLIPLSPTIQTYIGSDQRDHGSYFSGALASVAIYNYALTPNRILAHSTIGGVSPSLAITSGIIGGIVRDSKPAGTLHNGVSTGSTWLYGTNYGTVWLATATSVFDSSSTRNGVIQFFQTNNSQITIAPSPDFNSTTGTISFWVQYNLPGTLPGPGNGGPILFDRRNGGNGMLCYIAPVSGSGYLDLQTYYYSNSTFISSNIVGTTSMADGEWHHIAITYDQSATGFINTYVDGALDITNPNPGSWSWTPTQEIELGRSHDPYWKIYDGQMDDFRIYNRILSPAEISSMCTLANSDTLVDTSALKVRFNFDANNAPISGKLLVSPYGVLQSSPKLGAGAVWTNTANAITPQVFVPSPSIPAMFYRTTLTP